MKKSEYKNVTFDKITNLYTVATHDGKTKTYKTRRGAEAYAKKMKITIDVPSIVTANTYFWSPASSASGRRSNEKRRNEEMADFIAAVSAANCFVDASYSESCRHVYKEFSVYRGRRKSNIKGLAAECAKVGITLVW